MSCLPWWSTYHRKEFEEHLQNLQLVFGRLRRAGLKLKPSKCAVCQKEVTYLGRVVYSDGIATDLSKSEKVSNWPLPTSQREVKQFLGFVSYYRRFIKNFATIAKPPHTLLKKDAVSMDQPMSNSFWPPKTVPDYCTSAFPETFTLDTDASDTGIGAMLSQLDDNNQEHVIA